MKKQNIIILAILLTVGSTTAQESQPNLTMQVAKAVIDFNYSDIPPDVIEKAGQLINDNLAVAVGSHKAEVLKIMEMIFEVNGGDNLILHSGKKGKLLEAVYLNTLASNMLDFDDAHSGLGHPGCTIVQPALTLANHFGKSKEELIEAVVAGYEFNIRWAKAVFDYPGKMTEPFSVTLLQAFGTIVTAGKLLDLTDIEMARAFYFGASNMPLPVNQKTGILQGQTMNGLKNDYGQTAQSMVLAVLTAKNGVYSDTEVLDGPQGLWNMMGAKEFHEDELLKELGTRWDIFEMQIKPYASCRWSHAAIDGFYALLPEFTIDEVKKVDVYTFKAGAESVSGRNPTNMFEMQFSIPHVFGMVMYDESLIYMQESSITNQDVIAFSEKVEVHLDQKYEDMFNKGMLPAKVVIELKNGEILEKEILRMKGEMENPISEKEHKIKIETLIDSTPHIKVKDYAKSIINAN